MSNPQHITDTRSGRIYAYTVELMESGYFVPFHGALPELRNGLPYDDRHVPKAGTATLGDKPLEELRTTVQKQEEAEEEEMEESAHDNKIADIVVAIDDLDASDFSSGTQKPKASALARIIDMPVSARERDEAWDAHNKE